MEAAAVRVAAWVAVAMEVERTVGMVVPAEQVGREEKVEMEVEKVVPAGKAGAVAARWEGVAWAEEMETGVVAWSFRLCR